MEPCPWGSSQGEIWHRALTDSPCRDLQERLHNFDWSHLLGPRGKAAFWNRPFRAQSSVPSGPSQISCVSPEVYQMCRKVNLCWFQSLGQHKDVFWLPCTNSRTCIGKGQLREAGTKGLGRAGEGLNKGRLGCVEGRGRVDLCVGSPEWGEGPAQPKYVDLPLHPLASLPFPGSSNFHQ